MPQSTIPIRDFCRKIFNHPPAPQTIWEQQYDFISLKPLLKKDWHDLTINDLSLYLDDLKYIDKLQPDLFRYLFPICLAAWHEALMENGMFDDIYLDDFYLALHCRQPFATMISQEEQAACSLFICDSFIRRLEQEKGFVYRGRLTPAYSWLRALNDLACVLPVIPEIWDRWWRIDTPAQAVCVLIYASALIYFEGENPIFKPWTPEDGGGGPYLAELDPNIGEQGWLVHNMDFLKDRLTVDYLIDRVQAAADKLTGEPEEALAKKIAANCQKEQGSVFLLIEELTTSLAHP